MTSARPHRVRASRARQKGFLPTIGNTRAMRHWDQTKQCSSSEVCCRALFAQSQTSRGRAGGSTPAKHWEEVSTAAVTVGGKNLPRPRAVGVWAARSRHPTYNPLPNLLCHTRTRMMGFFAHNGYPLTDRSRNGASGPGAFQPIRVAGQNPPPISTLLAQGEEVVL